MKVNYVERIGKKYQWIATYELLSKLYDNYIPQYDIYTNTIIDLEKEGTLIKIIKKQEIKIKLNM